MIGFIDQQMHPKRESAHHSLHVSFSHPSSSRIVDMPLSPTLGGLACSLKTWTMKIDLGG